MIDKTLIERKIQLLESHKAQLEALQDKSLQAFLRDIPFQKSVEKFLQEMIEITMDIGKHIIAGGKMRLPSDSRDIFAILAEADIISDSLKTVLQDIVGFRNVLVHLYEQIDPNIVYSAYQKRLGDFGQYIQSILKFLSKT